MPQGSVRGGDPTLFEVVRICVNPDCVYAEFGFQAGSEVNLFSDPEQHADLCAVAPQVSQPGAECPYWQQSFPKPMPERQ